MSFEERQRMPYDTAAGTSGQSLLRVLLRRAPIIILVTLLATGAAAVLAYVNRDTYESTSKLLFRQTIGPESNAQGLIPGAPDADNLAQDNVALVDSRRVAVDTAAELGDTSADDVENDVTVTAKKDSDVVEVTAKADSAKGAATLADTYAKTAQRQAEGDQRAITLTAVRSVLNQLREMPADQRRGAASAGLRSRLEKLRTLAATGNGSPQIIQPGYVPDSKSGNPVETILLGALLGLVLGVALALLREQLDRRLHHAEDVSAAFDAPVLTTVPRNRKLKRHAPFHELPPEVAEAFRILQMNLRFGHVPPVRSVLVTSARSREGKTTVAWNLACAAASAGLSVAFIEADMRRPAVAERYGLQPGPGLSEALEGQVSVAKALQPFLPGPAATRLNGHQRPVHVLAAGHPAPDPWRLMQSPVVGRVLEVVERDHDFVVIDTPPIPHVADAISLVHQVDGVIVTASMSSTQGPEAGQLRARLQALGARVLGVVANGGSAASGYAYAPAPPVSSRSADGAGDGSGGGADEAPALGRTREY